MTVQARKMELIEMLTITNEVAVLKQLKEILESNLATISIEDYKIIDARRERHIKGESKSFSWAEAKQKIQKKLVNEL
jgi:hypothetical protein